MKDQIRCYRAALTSRQRKTAEMQTLKTTNQSLQSDNELLSISLQEMKETNTMLAAQLNEKLCRIMELEHRSPKHPVVFCHGLLGFDYLGPASMPPLQISHWRGIREVLESNGVEVLIARLFPAIFCSSG
ncbi:uncharacterized protein IAS62_001830 [Cryptococcus decagattii]|uniref:BZIP domain-containing protein n=1 Tax=Cryptococcus decagattii TaxID=1859122 RepID=A0ABZ2APS8_9TREE